MKNRAMIARTNSPRRNSDSGYTLLIVLLIVATILLMTAAAAPNIYVEGRRDRDEEMIWRGQQYVRAIGLYYKKYGHYPHTIDDLTNSDGQIRFLRQAYKDPMNTEDGSWRLIYIGPSGVLINSVMYSNIAQVGLPLGANPAPGGAPGDQGTAPSAASGGSASTPTDDDSQPQQLMTDVIGGNLIGVGSKIKKPSIKVYNGGTSYYQWEFIWKPLQGLAAGAVSAPAGSSSAPTPTPTPTPIPQVPNTAPGSGPPPVPGT